MTAIASLGNPAGSPGGSFGFSRWTGMDRHHHKNMIESQGLAADEALQRRWAQGDLALEGIKKECVVGADARCGGAP